MRLLVLLCAIWQVSGGGLRYRGVTVGITPYSAPVHAQYHAQNIYGQYMYGYATGLSAKDEIRTADGVTRGGYSYIDANGILQTVQYVSDPVNGFRVVATNIPHDLPEVAYARAQHLATHEHVRAEHALLHASQHRPNVPVALSPLPIAGGVPVVPVRALHIAAPPVTVVQQAAAVVPISSQFHAQDGLGQYTYGYAGPLTSKTETKTADGVTRGGYSYIDANGLLQTVQYVSDPVNGFRVAATNLPKAPAVTLIGPKVSTSVVGPRENVAPVAPETNVIVAGSVPVPVQPVRVDHGPVYIDQGPVYANHGPVYVDHGPVYSDAEVVANANIPIHGHEHQEEHFLQVNPNNNPDIHHGTHYSIAQPIEYSHGAQYIQDPQQVVNIHHEAQYVEQPNQVAQYVEQPHHVVDVHHGAQYSEDSRVHAADLGPTRGLLPPNQEPIPYAAHHQHAAQGYDVGLGGHAPAYYEGDAYAADANPAHLPNNHVILTQPGAPLPDNNPAIFHNPQNVGGSNTAAPIHLNSAQEGYAVSPIQAVGYRPDELGAAGPRALLRPVDVDILEQSAPNGGAPQYGSPQLGAPTYAERIATYSRPETNDGSPETGRLALFVPERHFAQSADGAAVNTAPALYLDQHESGPDHDGNQAARISEPRITGPTGYYTQNIQY